MENRKSERFFAELATAYAEKEAASLQDELAELEAENRLLSTAGLERKIKSGVFTLKFKKYSIRSLPLVASLVFALLLFNGYETNRPSSDVSAPSIQVVAEQPVYMAPNKVIRDNLLNSVELVSARLPAGYTLTGVDYDNAAAIMEITNEKSNLIVLKAEAYRDFDKEGFSVIKANGAVAYGMVNNDYCILKYSKDDMLYTLTSMYDYEDLLELFEHI
ncbi:MAG: DUF4367 domain-containing protein [Clostridiales bacterium]|nr:DUF4367 domain-containing protein [Clostridiales bacterium]